MLSPEARRARARLAAHRRWHPAEDPKPYYRELELAGAHTAIDAAIDAVVAALSKMTTRQRERLIAALAAQDAP